MNKSIFIILLLLLAGCQAEQTELEWQEEEGYRWADVELGFFGNIGFKELNPSQTNIDFEVNLTRAEIRENQMLLHGSGVATGDINNDGLTDLYLAQLNGPNRLYKNTGGLRFVDITDSAGVAHEGYYSTGVLFADIDGDRDQDLLVNTIEGPIGVYFNDGTGQFSQVEESGLGEGNGGSTFTMADIDTDGDLDLFVANNKRRRVYDIFSSEELNTNNIVDRQTGGGEEYKLREPFDQYYEILYPENRSNRIAELGTKNKLFLNEGGGTFREVTNEEGRFVRRDGNPYQHRAEWSLTALFQDINGDSLPDLYVCNDYFDPDRIWINRGDGTFREIDPLAIRSYSYSSMGAAVSDINRDGYSDIFVTEMLSQVHSRRARQQRSEEVYLERINRIDYQPQYMRNSLYLNRGDQTFAEIAWFSGIQASEWSWATRFLDVDLDGYEDIIINTGFAYDSIDLDYFEDRNRDKSGVDLEETPELNLRNKFFRNNGDLTFTEMSSEWGFNEEDVSYGLATADFDNDGDLDMVTSRFKSGAALFENRSNSPRIAVRLRGNPPNTDGIGAEITLEGGPVPQSKQLASGGDYLSGSVPQVVFAASSENTNHTITVRWPDGKRSTVDSVQANRIYEIREPASTGGAGKQLKNVEPSPEPVFREGSGQLNHQHHEDHFNDFGIQPLLPMQLSRLGPGISWIDFDSDGDDDLFISSGKGGRAAVYENEGDGVLISNSIGSFTETNPTDQTAILGWNTDEGTTLIAGNANYETENLKTSSAFVYQFRDGQMVKKDSIPGIYSTTGPLAAADYDGDGDLDLFVGGRFVPAHYPMNADSRLFKNENGRFVLDENNSGKLESSGLVTGAVFSDIDGDRDPDLLLSREWDSLLLLENNNGTFSDVTAEYGLERYRGWWNGVATGDFNNDGRPDIVATNRGLNSPYQLDSAFPLRMFYNDFNRDGRADVIESYFDPVMSAYVPRRQMQDYESISSTMLSGIGTHREYAESTLQEMLGTGLQNIPSREINTLAHLLFINNGDGFTAQPLPAEAQFTAAFYAGTADYDNDGFDDLFLSQNFFGLPVEMPRLDAGRGLWLKGDGSGNLRPVPGQKSGVKVYGEQRGAALSDFNGDGKTDLVISQNDTTTKLYLNQTTNRGISVSMIGSTDNRTAVGSSLRLIYQDGSSGPLREIQAGSGYWSQNSADQILGVQEGKVPVSFHIRWPDGSVDTVEIEVDKWEYHVTYR